MEIVKFNKQSFLLSLLLLFASFFIPQSLYSQFVPFALWQKKSQSNGIVVVVSTGVNTTTDRDVTLPLNGTVNATIDWGDPTANSTCPTTGVTGLVTCRMPASNTQYTIEVSGTVTQFGMGDSSYSNPLRIVRVDKWGDVGLTSLAGAFRGASNLTTVAAPPTTVTDMSSMFEGPLVLINPLALGTPATSPICGVCLVMPLVLINPSALGTPATSSI